MLLLQSQVGGKSLPPGSKAVRPFWGSWSLSGLTVEAQKLETQ